MDLPCNLQGTLQINEGPPWVQDSYIICNAFFFVYTLLPFIHTYGLGFLSFASMVFFQQAKEIKS